MLTEKKKKLSNPGFTLLELMVLISILGVLITLSAPLFKETYYDLQLSTTTENVAKLLLFAQSKAVFERTKYRFNVDSSSRRYWVSFTRNVYDENFVTVQDRFCKKTFPDGIMIESEKGSIVFYPDGSGDSTKIYVKGKKSGRVIIVNGNIGDVEIKSE